MYPNCFETAWRESCVSTIPKRSSFEHATFDSQALYIQALTNSIALSLSPSKSVSVSPTGSHTSKELHIYIKTMAFKPFRDTYLQSTFLQTLLNHILAKKGVGGGGVTRLALPPSGGEKPRLFSLPRSPFCATFHGSER